MIKQKTQNVGIIHELPLQNRNVLDDIAFDILGVTEDEQNEGSSHETERNQLQNRVEASRADVLSLTI